MFYLRYLSSEHFYVKNTIFISFIENDTKTGYIVFLIIIQLLVIALVIKLEQWQVYSSSHYK